MPASIVNPDHCSDFDSDTDCSFPAHSHVIPTTMNTSTTPSHWYPEGYQSIQESPNSGWGTLHEQTDAVDPCPVSWSNDWRGSAYNGTIGSGRSNGTWEDLKGPYYVNETLQGDEDVDLEAALAGLGKFCDFIKARAAAASEGVFTTATKYFFAATDKADHLVDIIVNALDAYSNPEEMQEPSPARPVPWDEVLFDSSRVYASEDSEYWSHSPVPSPWGAVYTDDYLWEQPCESTARRASMESCSYCSGTSGSLSELPDLESENCSETEQLMGHEVLSSREH
ncbi:hypothetical protein M422DRAFT_25179 [Sphaerobolus stellatus SS14]|nr:hypothetical protein M422DRAFT_25179 [Sphaerobolus stellatus SS14]